jgi:hypothetical protein
VHLLHHARLTFEAGKDCVGMELDVMHLIFRRCTLLCLIRRFPLMLHLS